MLELLPLIVEKDGIPVTTSRAVAEQFGKQHKHVLRDIEQLIGQLNATEDGKEFNQSNFGLVKYLDAKGEQRPSYLLTRDGFTLLAMGFTGAKALAFKVAYINAFNRMEQLLKGGGLSSSAIQDIERRLDALERAAGQGKTEVLDSISALFVTVIQDALESGEYYIKDKWDRKPQERKGVLLGVKDGSRTFLKTDVAYGLYRAASSTFISRAGLWAILEEKGTIYPRASTKGGRRIACERQMITVVCIDSEKLKMRTA